MQHMIGTDKNLVYVSIVASQRAQSHACTLYFATFTPGGKSGNDRLISGPMVTHMRNGSMKAAEMEPFYILVREEKASLRHSKVRGGVMGNLTCSTPTNGRNIYHGNKIPVGKAGSWRGRRHRLRYWVLLFVMPHPASSGWWALARWSRVRYVPL